MYVDTSRHCLQTSEHCQGTLMNEQELGLKIKKKYNFYKMVLSDMFLYVIGTCILHRWWHSDVNSSLIHWHKMSITQLWIIICCHISCKYENGMGIPFPKQYRYGTNHLDMYTTNDYFFSAQLPSYCLLCALHSSMLVSPEMQHLPLL